MQLLELTSYLSQLNSLLASYMLYGFISCVSNSILSLFLYVFIPAMLSPGQHDESRAAFVTCNNRKLMTRAWSATKFLCQACQLPRAPTSCSLFRSCSLLSPGAHYETTGRWFSAAFERYIRPSSSNVPKANST